MITIRDEHGNKVAIDATKILAVAENKSNRLSRDPSEIHSLIIFKDNSYGYMFSTETQESIMDKIKQSKAKQTDDEECSIGLTD